MKKNFVARVITPMMSEYYKQSGVIMVTLGSAILMSLRLKARVFTLSISGFF